MAEQITSIKDSRVLLARELQTGAGRKKHQKFLVYGLEQIEWALQKGIELEYVFAEEVLPELPVLFLTVTSGILKKISGTNYVIPYIGIAQVPHVAPKQSDFVVVLDDIQDYGNLGTILRTAHGLFVDSFMFTNALADPYQRKVIDSSRGSVFQSNFTYQEDPQATIDRLKQDGYQLVVTSPHAQYLQSQTPLQVGKPVALIVGNETRGVDDTFIEQADVVVQIPMSQRIESLNVGVAAGISIYELKFRQVLLMLKEKIFANFGREVNVLGKYIQMAFDAEISRVTDLNGKQIILLMILHCDQSMNEEQIEKDTGLHDDALHLFLTPLHEKRLLIESDEHYSLTVEGETFLAEIWPVVEQTQQKLFTGLEEKEVEQFMTIMKKIKDSCISIIAKNEEN